MVFVDNLKNMPHLVLTSYYWITVHPTKLCLWCY